MLQTMKDSGLIDSLNLAKTFPENKGYWQRSGIWHVLTIKKEEFCNDNCYKPLHEVRNLRAIIETLDQAFREFVDKDLIPIKEREEELR